MVVVVTGQFWSLPRLLTCTRRRGRTAVVAVMMRLMLMGRMGEHGGRRVLVMMMVMVMGSSDHGVTVNVLLAATATNVIDLVMTTGRRGATCVETQQLLNGEWRPLRQRRCRYAAGCGQQAAQQSWSGHVNVTIGMLK